MTLLFTDYLLRIKEIDVIQEGTIKIRPARSFEEGGLHPAMLANVKLAGYDVPTPIQAYCLPAILKGHDVVACAQTGTFINFAQVSRSRANLFVAFRVWKDCGLFDSYLVKVDGQGEEVGRSASEPGNFPGGC